MKKITLTKNIGTAKKGDVFVQALHGSPTYYKDTPPTDWYWKQGSAKEDNEFLPASVFRDL